MIDLKKLISSLNDALLVTYVIDANVRGLCKNKSSGPEEKQKTTQGVYTC
jgi:hypothetical protein